MSTFADRVIDYHLSLQPVEIPDQYSFLYPFEQTETIRVFRAFYERYFSDEEERILLMGINPGRLGAGITGIGFTDPVVLTDQIGIEHSFDMKRELSSIFITDMINAIGGFEVFYSRFYIASVCPLGFVTDTGINCNYYDDRKLQEAVEPMILRNIRAQLSFGCSQKVIYSIGKGKNYKYLKALNKQHNIVEKVLPLPHPRWVMQYKLKTKNLYIDQYLNSLAPYL